MGTDSGNTAAVMAYATKTQLALNSQRHAELQMLLKAILTAVGAKTGLGDGDNNQQQAQPNQEESKANTVNQTTMSSTPNQQVP